MNTVRRVGLLVWKYIYLMRAATIPQILPVRGNGSMRTTPAEPRVMSGALAWSMTPQQRPKA